MASRLAVGALGVTVVAVGGFWLRGIVRGDAVTGLHSSMTGLALVGLVVALAAAITRLRDDR